MSLFYEMLPVLFLFRFLDLYSMRILIINVNEPIYILTVGHENEMSVRRWTKFKAKDKTSIYDREDHFLDRVCVN